MSLSMEEMSEFLSIMVNGDCELCISVAGLRKAEALQLQYSVQKLATVERGNWWKNMY